MSAEPTSRQLEDLIAVIEGQKGVLHLKVRLLRGMIPQLRAAREAGLTWPIIFAALKRADYPGSYTNFVRSAARLLREGDGLRSRSTPTRRSHPAAATEIAADMERKVSSTSEDRATSEGEFSSQPQNRTGQPMAVTQSHAERLAQRSEEFQQMAAQVEMERAQQQKPVFVSVETENKEKNA